MVPKERADNDDIEFQINFVIKCLHKLIKKVAKSIPLIQMEFKSCGQLFSTCHINNRLYQDKIESFSMRRHVNNNDN